MIANKMGLKWKLDLGLKGKNAKMMNEIYFN